MEEERRHVTVGDARIYYQARGQGAPVVLVHGLSGSSRWWAHNVDALTRSRRVYLVDLIRFGQSEGHRFVLSEAADSLVQWMDALGLPCIDLVGHSMGGYIAADLAATHPDRVGRLVLVDAAAFPEGYSTLRSALGLVQALAYLPVDFLPILFTDALRARPWTILQAARELLAANIGDRLHEIAAPTLVVWGEHDKAVPLEIGRRIAQAIPSAELHVVEGAGHNPMWDRAAVFNALVEAFLADRTADDGALAAPGAHE